MVIVIILAAVYLIGIPFFAGLLSPNVSPPQDEVWMLAVTWPVAVPVIVFFISMGWLIIKVGRLLPLRPITALIQLGQKLGARLNG